MDIRRRMFFKKNGGSYTVNLNSQWEATTAVPNPDPTLYDGVYRSASNYNVNSGVATMYITIKDCSSFKMYIRSHAESNYDYVMVSQLNQTINGNTDYSNTTLVKAHTRGNQQSGTTLANYTLVEFTGISSGEHTITVVYRKDGSAHNGDDRGYVLIENSQAGSGDSGGDDEGESSEGPINTDNYLTIEALEDGLTASLSLNKCEYCVDGDGNWKTLSAGNSTKSINIGHTLSFRGNLTPNSSNGIGTFTISKKCNLNGNCMSMLFGGNAANNYSLSGKIYAFRDLFENCSNIVNVSSNFLPATTLASGCYYTMFYGCTSLTTAPELPATTLVDSCYESMFYSCTSLTTAPELPATTLANRCYYDMFDYCTGLTTAPELPATTLADNCYNIMFYNCRSLVNAPELPATTLKTGCYYYMFYYCTSLTTAPELSATTLADKCYSGMFRGCTSLTTAPELSATTLRTDCYSYMFHTCTGLTTAPTILPATTLASACYNSMFYGCKSLTTAPELSATKVASNCCASMFSDCPSLTTAPTILPARTVDFYCYSSMFYGCKSLTTAPELPATTLGHGCYINMFCGCTSLTTAPELPATILTDMCYNSMFSNCPSLTTAPTLPATKLVYACYNNMFSWCTKLNYIKMLATDISAQACLTDWVYNVASVGTFVKNPAMTTLPSGTSGIPSGWTVQNATS